MTTKRPRKAPGEHRAAVTRMLRSTGLLHVPEEAPLVVTLKTLAARLDADPGDARARSHWLTALGQLRQALNVAPGRPKGSTESSVAVAAQSSSGGQADSDPQPVPNQLAEWKQRRGIA